MSFQLSITTTFANLGSDACSRVAFLSAILPAPGKRCDWPQMKSVSLKKLGLRLASVAFFFCPIAT